MPSVSLKYDSDEILASGLLPGNRRAFDNIYRCYAPALLGYIEKAIMDKAGAEKVLQRAFTEIWQNRTTFDPAKERLFTWLRKQVKRTTMNYNALKQKKNEAENPKTSSFVDIYDVKGKSEEEMNKKVLELLYYKNCSLQEVSAALGLDEEQLKVMLRCAMKNLKPGLK